ncbi:PilW family protein [Thiorhodococcus minor]|uniref:Prepilin-type N-terminal cleavage/methylation domain-containing protein n=1 Tax=Thiorhodococcus minor TaxID=57489 RepID=A0A6M0K5F6_9GAMM|nr:PilW family protein [Thiorhodococcus minor]NEV65008.1 hypothetical protein [Thiorhodococcus minor]
MATSFPNNRMPPLMERGLSLIELLVGMTVGLFVLGGVLALFVSNKHAYRVQEASNFLQETGRIAVGQLAQSLRMAGHWGGVEPGNISIDSSLSIAGIGNCNASWITDVKTELRGYDSESTIAAIESGQGLPSGCIGDADYLSGTDILVVRYAQPVTLVAQPSIMLRSAIGLRGVLGNVPSLGSLPTFDLPIEDGTQNYSFRSEVWFIRPCSDATGGSSASSCDSGDDDGSPVPTLARLALEGTELRQQAMYDGIEQLQIEFGRDTDGDNSVDRVDTAATINASASPVEAWGEVISARIALISRSLQRDATFTGTQDFTLAGDKGAGTDGFTVPTSEKNYLRKTYEQTVQIRNRVR